VNVVHVLYIPYENRTMILLEIVLSREQEDEEEW
jgi:hypothetical protein